MEDKIKDAFSKVKKDIFSLGEEISSLKLLITDMKNDIKIITKAINDIKEKEILGKPQEKIPKKTHEIQQKTYAKTPAYPEKSTAIQQITPTQEEIPTDKLLSQVLKSQNTAISTGNEGVPTDRQTNQQTDRHIIQHINIPQNQQKTAKIAKIDHLEKASELLENLDTLKKEIRRKFKTLTNQEMHVFSLLYQLDYEENEVDYPLLSSKLSLSESSIRDYIGKIQRKGIPIIKEKLNNKRVVLHISQDLKKIASLDTILKLREM